MQEQKGVSTLVGTIIIVLAAVVLFGGVFAWQYYLKLKINQPENQIISAFKFRPPSESDLWKSFYNKYRDKFEKNESPYNHARFINKNTILFSPDNKLVSFIVAEKSKYNFSRPHLVDVNTGVDIFEDADGWIWFENPKKSLFWFDDGKLLVVKTDIDIETNRSSGGAGQKGIFMLNPENKLIEIYSDRGPKDGIQISNINFSNNKILFSLVEGATSTKIKDYSYDIAIGELDSVVSGWDSLCNYAVLSKVIPTKTLDEYEKIRGEAKNALGKNAYSLIGIECPLNVNGYDYIFSFTRDAIKIADKNKSIIGKLKVGADKLESGMYDLYGYGKPIILTDEDVNFDGYKDLVVDVGNGYGGVNFFYNFYLFNPLTNKFDEVPILESVCGLNVQSDKKQIISRCKSGPGYCEAIYKFDGKKYYGVPGDNSLCPEY